MVPRDLGPTHTMSPPADTATPAPDRVTASADAGVAARGTVANGAGQTAGDPPPNPAALPDAPPGFVLEAEIGRGGMGVVYRARDLALDREVAVKVLLDKYPAESTTATRFVEEARITGQLQHPGIPAVYQVGRFGDGRPYLAMKLIKGRTLHELLAEGVPLDTLGVFEAIGQAVGYAHAHGVIHRDLKPHNVMVGAFGEVQVMDWGLAKLLPTLPRTAGDAGGADPDTTASGTEIRTPRDSDTPFTLHGSALGTPAYMPPEQAAGELDKVDRRSDVFGLGAILCVLLTGKPPFTGANAEGIRLAALRGKTETAFARLDASGAEPEVVSLCKRCLAFECDDRPADAYAVAHRIAELRKAADDRARQAEVAQAEAAEQRKRRRTVMVAGGILLVILSLGVVGTVIGLLEVRRQRDATDFAWSEEATARGIAEQKTLAAEAARVEAERTAADAKAVRSLLEDILKQGSSDGRGAAGLKVEAGVTVKQAMDYTARSVGERFKDQPRVEGEVRDSLGTTYYKMGAYPEAIQQLEKAVEVRRAALGPDAEDTLKSLNNLAVAYRTVGRNPEAERLLTEVLAAKRRVLGDANRSTLTTVNNLGNYYLQQKDYDRAERYFQEAFDGRRALLGDDDIDTQISLNNVAAVRFRRDRFADALPLYQASADGFTKKLTRDSATTLRVVTNLAICHSRLGQRERAEELLLEVVRRSAVLLPTEKKQLLPEAAKELVALYDGWGKPADGARWRQQLKDYLPPETAPPPRPAPAK